MHTKETWKYVNVQDFRSFGSKLNIEVIGMFWTKRTQNRLNSYGRQRCTKDMKDTL